jgi:hypothetical protein
VSLHTDSRQLSAGGDRGQHRAEHEGADQRAQSSRPQQVGDRLDWCRRRAVAEPPVRRREHEAHRGEDAHQPADPAQKEQPAEGPRDRPQPQGDGGPAQGAVGLGPAIVA